MTNKSDAGLRWGWSEDRKERVKLSWIIVTHGKCVVDVWGWLQRQYTHDKKGRPIKQKRHPATCDWWGHDNSAKQMFNIRCTWQKFHRHSLSCFFSVFLSWLPGWRFEGTSFLWQFSNLEHSKRFYTTSHFHPFTRTFRQHFCVDTDFFPQSRSLTRWW